MSEIKFNNKKFISDDDGFKITQDNDDFPGWNVLLSHDGDDSLKTIGEGNDFINQMIPQILVDDGYIDLPADSAGFGKIEVGESEENLIFTWARDNTVTLVDNSTNVVAADTDAKFCVFDNTSSVRIKNRLGTAQSVLFDIHYTELPIAPTFQVFNILSGVDNLDPELTINSVTVEPTFRYTGGDADGTDWNYWGYGADLDLESGTVPSYNQGSPGLGPNDYSVLFNEGGYYQASENTTGDLTTEDAVFEIVCRLGVDSNLWIADKRQSLSQGWTVDRRTPTKFRMWIEDSSANDAQILSAELTEGAWYHAMCFIDRSGSAQWYVNGIASGSAVAVSSVGDMTVAQPMTIGAQTGGTTNYDSEVAYFSMWKSASWLDTHLQATVAKERFAKLCGYFPEMCNGGTDDITTAERTYPAYLDKVENGYRKLYYVGSEWLRMCHRQDSEEVDVYGYLPETEAENLIVESEDFLTTWTLIDAGDTVLNDQVVCPDGRTKAGSIGGDASDSSHGISITATLTAATYSFSCFAKPGNLDWVNLRDVTVSNCYCYFDVANGTVGHEGSGCTGYIEGPFYSGDAIPFYRCCIVFTGDASSNTLWIRPAFADTDADYSGDGSADIYIWGAQCELGDYMTSPVVTDGGAATRLKDQLQYVAGANIGGEDVGKGTTVCDLLTPDYDNSDRLFAWSINDGASSADRIAGFIGTDDRPSVLTRATGLNNGDAGVVADVSDNEKHEMRATWETDDLIIYSDGVASAADASADIPDDLDQLHIGMNVLSVNHFNGLIQNFRIYDEPTTLG